MHSCSSYRIRFVHIKMASCWEKIISIVLVVLSTVFFYFRRDVPGKGKSYQGGASAPSRKPFKGLFFLCLQNVSELLSSLQLIILLLDH